MSLALIQESAKEVRRLAIAGSPLAVGDFRLKKLVPPLEQAGAKVPVFAQVAKSISELVDGSEANSAANLLGLSTLLNAILYTQGQSGATGDYKELESFTANVATTKTPARVLKPLIEALTTTGGGRFEIVKSAYERGAFNDLRLIDPSLRALDDKYPELADLVAEKILPAFGPAIVPRLKGKLNLKGSKADARRLQIMHQLDPAGTVELCKTALEEGAAEVKAVAVACLGLHEECFLLVMEQAKAKNKLVRTAALAALAALDRSETTALFTDMIKGKSLDLLTGPFRALQNRQVLNSMIDEGKRVYELVLKGDAEQIPRYWEILNCLIPRSDAEVNDFYLACFGRIEKLTKLRSAKDSHVSGPDVIFQLAELLYDIGSPASLEAILKKRALLQPEAFGFVLRSALRTWPSAKVFEEFSPLLGQTKGADKEKRAVLEKFIQAANWNEHSRFLPEETTERDAALLKLSWDPRWLDAAIKANEATIVCCLAQPGHKACLAYLLKLSAAKKISDPGLLIRALARCQHPEVSDLFTDFLATKAKSASYVDYEMNFLLENARHLPAADLPKLDTFAAKLDAKFVDAYLEALAPLRQTAPIN